MRNVLLLSIVFLFVACSSKYDSIPNAKEHMIESNKLKELIREMDMVIYDRFKSELQRDDIRRRYVLSLADRVEKLASHVKYVDHSELGIYKTKEGAKKFKSYSNKLYKNSEELHDIAKSYELEKLSSALVNMENICNSCHNDFKDK